MRTQTGPRRSHQPQNQVVHETQLFYWPMVPLAILSLSLPTSSQQSLICQYNDDVIEITDSEGLLSDCDKTKGPEHEAAIRSPPKGKKCVTNLVSNKPS